MIGGRYESLNFYTNRQPEDKPCRVFSKENNSFERMQNRRLNVIVKTQQGRMKRQERKKAWQKQIRISITKSSHKSIYKWNYHVSS